MDVAMENRFAAPGREAALLGRAAECELLSELVAAVRSHNGRSLVLRGEPGIGKTALLEHLAETASDLTVIRAAGVESEMELPYASLHLLCGGLLDHLPKLPAPQCRALEVVFGLSDGVAPDRLLVGLGVLSLLSEAAEGRPLLCIVDDAQWLDQSSGMTLAFVGRRLLAEPVGLVFAVRPPGDELRHLPGLEVGGLDDPAARTLLSSSVQFRVNAQVRDRIVAETRGNPLALLELPRGLSATELAGLGTTANPGLISEIEQSFRRRLDALPEETRRLLLIAAAEPLGDPAVLWRAAERQGIDAVAATPAIWAGLCGFGARVRFRHPLARTAAYGSASAEARRRAHAAIAEVTDPDRDPDRRAWHRALAASRPDDAVADELERSAARARARGGQAAAAAFLQRSASLTVDPAGRARRVLAAAEARYLAGSPDEALRLVSLAERQSLDELQRVRVEVLRGKVAVTQRHAVDAPSLLLGAAQRLEPFDRRVARETFRDAFIAAIYAGRSAGDGALLEVAAAARSAAPSTEPPSVADELLDAAAVVIESGVANGAQAAQRALGAFRDTLSSPALDVHWLFFAARVLAPYVWDAEGWDALSAKMLELVRDAGVLALLPMAAAQRVGWELFTGDLAAASALVEEQEAVHEAIGGDRSPGSRIALAALRGREAEVAQLDEATTPEALARGDGPWVGLASWSTAVLCNALGRFDRALPAAQLAAAYPPDVLISNWALSELVEAAARCGQPEAAQGALGRLAEAARACGTDWILGVEARAQALVADRAFAEEPYREAIERLSRTRLRTEVARTRLLYGEWLRRENRRADARAQLGAAYDEFSSIGMEAFAERARMELLASGEKVRKRKPESRAELTDQERRIAGLADAGLSNAEIGARLFLSPRTVEWHLRKVFTKLGIHSRRELPGALPVSGAEPPPP
jgi:DNA-binding CsgD family transcriptional regulator